MTKSQFLNNLFKNLNNNKIEYFVIGPYESLPDDTGGSDIDIIVKHDYIANVDTVIRELILQAENTCLASFYTNLNTNFYRILSSHWGVQIDIFHKSLCYKGVEYFPVNILWKDVVMHNGTVKVLPKAKGYYVDFFKEVIHIGRAKDKYIEALLKFSDESPEECFAEIESIYGAKSVKLLRQAIANNSIKQIIPELRYHILNYIFKGKCLKKARYIVNSITRLVKQKPGYCIAFLGTDGSGKSTIINAITPILNEGFHNGVVYHHLRPSLLPDLGILLGKKKAGNNEINSDPHGKKPSGLLGSLFRWIYYLVDYSLGFLIKVWPSLHTKSKVHIFDRYYYDYYVDQKRSRTSLPSWILHMGEIFVPEPDIVFCLGGNPSLIYERKPETSIEEVTQQTETLRIFCRKHKNSVWIDTTKSKEQSINECITRLIAKFNNFYR